MGLKTPLHATSTSGSFSRQEPQGRTFSAVLTPLSGVIVEWTVEEEEEEEEEVVVVIMRQIRR